MKLLIELLGKLLPSVLAMLSKKDGKAMLNKLFNVVEDAVEKSENKLDDAIVLPVMKKLRELLDVPDVGE